MEKESLLGQTVDHMKVSTIKIKSKVKVSIPGLTDANTMANGLMENSMDREDTQTLKERQRLELGKMERKSFGFNH